MGDTTLLVAGRKKKKRGSIRPFVSQKKGKTRTRTGKGKENDNRFGLEVVRGEKRSQRGFLSTSCAHEAEGGKKRRCRTIAHHLSSHRKLKKSIGSIAHYLLFPKRRDSWAYLGISLLAEKRGKGRTRQRKEPGGLRSTYRRQRAQESFKMPRSLSRKEKRELAQLRQPQKKKKGDTSCPSGRANLSCDGEKKGKGKKSYRRQSTMAMRCFAAEGTMANRTQQPGRGRLEKNKLNFCGEGGRPSNQTLCGKALLTTFLRTERRKKIGEYLRTTHTNYCYEKKEERM